MANTLTSTCLETVIGLADQSCICTEESRPEDYSVSKSGRYLADENFGLPMSKLEKLVFRNDDTVWDWLIARRLNGIKSFLSDLELNIPENNRLAYSKYSGMVGDIKEWSYALAGLGARTGIAIHPKLFRGVKATIHGVRLWYPGLESGVVDFHLSTDLLAGNTTPIYQLAFSGNTGNIVHVAVPSDSPLIIGLEDDYGEPVAIFATIANGGNMPLNTRFFCASCGTPAWGRFFFPQNITVADSDALIPIAKNRTVPYGSANYGVALHLTVECSDSWMCGSMNYSSTWPRVMAEAMQLYQQRDAMMDILKMEHMNPASIFGRDELVKSIENINTLLEKRMPYLGQNVPISLSDCLICDDGIMVMDMIV